MEKSLLYIIQSFASNRPGFSLFKNIELIYMGCNLFTAKLCGFKNYNSLIGKTDYDTKCKAAKYAEIFRSQDKKAIENSSPLIYLDINQYANGTKLIVSKRNPLVDVDNKVIGLLTYGTDFSDKINHLITAGIVTSDLVKDGYQSLELIDSYNSELTKKESECLFFAIRNRSMDEVARFMKLSKKELNNCVTSIIDNMQCDNIDQTIEKSLSLNYINMLPKSLVMSMLKFV